MGRGHHCRQEEVSMPDINIRDVPAESLKDFKIIGAKHGHKHQRETLQMLVEIYKKTEYR